jgi:hypothetical protein
MTALEEDPDRQAESIDEELESAVARFEYGWLIGVVVGLLVLALFARIRERRRRPRDSADGLYR